MNNLNLVLGILAFALSLFSILLAIFLYYCANARNSLIGEIREVLEKCRECSSWDDRSELKLFQYIGAEENRLGRYTLKALVEIRNRTYEYWKVHLEMDGKGDEYPYRIPFCTWKQFLRFELFGTKTDKFIP
jgi:hypothetical protein